MIHAALETLIGECVGRVLEMKGTPRDLPRFSLSTPPPMVKGDLASNIALVMAKSVGKAPRALADDIIDGFPASPLIQKVETAGAGFLNFHLSDHALHLELESLLERDFSKPVANKGAESAKKILIEFVSANPTGPLHIGHGRGAALGDSLVRIYRCLGYPVSAEYYINDAGGQIRNLGFSVEARLKELKGEKTVFPPDGYNGAYVVELAKQARQSGKTFKPVEKTQMVFDQSDLAGFASERLLKNIQNDLRDFGVEFDHWTKESTLHQGGIIPALFSALKEKGCAYEREGALWFRATQTGDEKDRVLKKGNESPTYFASDIAYHADKFRRGFKKLINVWGADHHGYAQRLKGAVRVLGHDSDELEIVLNQMVSVKGGRLSKRAGEMITLREVMDEVGKDAMRFFFALRSPGAHFEFDLDLATRQASDNPVYYVQYVHARCCSIFREAKKRELHMRPLMWKKNPTQVPVSDAERSVLLHLSEFEGILHACLRDISNHHLTGYLMDLAGKFHSFYEKCRVLDDNPSVRSFRLGLVEALRRHVAQGLNLLGVSAPDRL